MKFLFILFISFILFSCSDSGSLIGKQLSGSDSLVIHFNIPRTNTIEKTMTTTETNAINKLTRFVDTKTTEINTCSYDGNLLFYKKGQLAGDVSFTYTTEECRHFIFLINGKLTATKMSNEAGSFLTSLSEDKSWY